MHEWGRARDAFLLEREYGAVFKGMDYGTRLTRFESWHHHFGFLDGLRGQESACKSGDPGLIPGTGRSLRGENGNPPQYSCLENPMDRGGAGGVQSIGLQRVRHYWATSLSLSREDKESNKTCPFNKEKTKLKTHQLFKKLNKLILILVILTTHKLFLWDLGVGAQIFTKLFFLTFKSCPIFFLSPEIASI